MKRVLFGILGSLIFNTANAKVELGVGYSGSKDFNIILDVRQDDGWVYGIQIGLGDKGAVGTNYTETVNPDQFREDIYEVRDDSYIVAGRFGKDVIENLRIVGVVGVSVFNEVQNRFDRFRILGNNGHYYVKTGRTNYRGYASAIAQLKLGRISLSAGYGSRGSEVGLHFSFN